MSAHRDDEDDPTGMRHLLSSMSDPEPMSEDMVRRITADIEQERMQGGSDAHRFDPAVSAPAPSRRRRHAAGLAVLGGAAALALALPVLSDALSRPSAPTSAAFLNPASSGSTTSSPDAAATPGGATSPASGSSPAAGALALVATGTHYHRGDFDAQVADLLAHAPTPTAPTPTETGSAGPTSPDATAASVQGCLEALSLDDESVVVDLATYEGQPSLVVVGAPSHGSSGDLRTAAVMPRDCDHTHTSPLAGPFRLR